jgi:hypothetical protein
VLLVWCGGGGATACGWTSLGRCCRCVVVRVAVAARVCGWTSAEQLRMLCGLLLGVRAAAGRQAWIQLPAAASACVSLASCKRMRMADNMADNRMCGGWVGGQDQARPAGRQAVLRGSRGHLAATKAQRCCQHGPRHWQCVVVDCLSQGHRCQAFAGLCCCCTWPIKGRHAMHTYGAC